MFVWLMFLSVGAIWGSSYLLIKIGVNEFDPIALVALRLGIAAVCFAVMFLVTRRRFPRDPRTLGILALVGITNTALPFILITWGEKYIDSAIAGVLVATTPLFSLVIAHLALADDKITLGKLLGLIAGFTGIVLLATRTAGDGQNSILGQVAILGASASYGISSVIIKKTLKNVEPMTVAGVTLMVGGGASVLFMLLAVRPLPNLSLVSTGALLAVIILGVLNTYIAYVLFFRVIKAWSATRATMVTYIAPPFSIALGLLFGSERFDIRLIIGAVLIIGGVILANMWKDQPLFKARTAQA
ncbi:MAG TPA: DMT family transporter [Aggregatilineales bacterium]|nr:DMT family transporter [Anaerolineales bacterium]HRE47884.1 DMT family transporter [Aggregatilineales bacterium]